MKEYEYTDSEGNKYRMQQVDITRMDECWNKLYLEDGTVLRVRLLVGEAGKSIDKPVPGGKGEPLYHIKSQTIVIAEVPEDQYIGAQEEEQ